jgi:hypothetical protein
MTLYRSDKMTDQRLPEFKIVRINETEYWDLADTPAVKEVWAIYLVDVTRSHFCCEITPSYWLDFLDMDFVMKEGYTEKECIEAHDLLYFNHNSESTYMHQSVIKNSEKIKVEDFKFDELDWLEEFDLSVDNEYFEMLSVAHESVREWGCYW